MLAPALSTWFMGCFSQICLEITLKIGLVSIGSDLHFDFTFGNSSKGTEIHFGVLGDFLLTGFALGA